MDELDLSIVRELALSLSVMKPSKVSEDDEKGLIKLDHLLDSPEYAADRKMDGCHYMMCGNFFFSNEHVEKTDNYPHLRDFFKLLRMPNLILDGEINYPDKTSQFCTRVTGASAGKAVEFQNGYEPIHYNMFDILRLPSGKWLLKTPYSERRKILEFFYNTYVKGTSIEKYLHLTDIDYNNKRQFKDEIIASGGEGVVLKKLSSIYVMGKKPKWQWVKIKQQDEADFVIMGFDAPNMLYTGKNLDSWKYWRDIEQADGSYARTPVTKLYYNNWIGAVQLGAYVHGELKQVCTSSGMTEDTRKSMSEHSDMYIGKVARITFMEKTEANIPRHPRFIDLHPDKRPEECKWELK